MDIILLLLGFILAVGLTCAAFLSNLRFMISMLSGVAWIAFGLLTLDLNLVLPLCCFGMGLYMMARSVVD